MKYALKNLSPNKSGIESNLLTLSFFFHGRGSVLQHTILGFYRSILHQILDRAPSVLSDLVTVFKKNCETRGEAGLNWDWHETELRAFLNSSIPTILEHYSIRIFVDGLDESGESAAVKLVNEIQNLMLLYPNTSGSVFSICFSCRRYPIIDLEVGLEICIDQENFDDIRTYIQSRLPNEKHEIREAIIQRATNNFQWARLVVDHVVEMRRNGKTAKMIKAEIWRIPRKLKDLYRELLESISEEDLLEALRLFQWILFAMQPLSLDELRFAIAIYPELSYTSLRRCEDEGILAENHDKMERMVKSLSRGLAEIQMHKNKPIIQLIHQSVNDFLFEDGLQILLGERWESRDLASAWAHYSLSRSCIRYIDMKEIAQHRSTSWKTAAESKFPFLSYATRYWPSHAEHAYAKGISQVDLMKYLHWPSESLLEQWIEIYRELDSGERNSPPRKTTLSHLASYYGIADLLLTILNTSNRIDVTANLKDEYGQTLLSIAAREGHEAIVKLLLDAGKVEADSRDMIDQTPLSLASERGHKAIVKLLLDTGKVEADSRDNIGKTPLSLASGRGHETIVKLLLDTAKVKPDSRDDIGQTPLLLASKRGHEAIVKLLLDTGKVKPDSRDDIGQTPLSLASKRGHETIVKLLLGGGAKFE